MCCALGWVPRLQTGGRTSSPGLSPLVVGGQGWAGSSRTVTEQQASAGTSTQVAAGGHGGPRGLSLSGIQKDERTWNTNWGGEREQQAHLPAPPWARPSSGPSSVRLGVRAQALLSLSLYTHECVQEPCFCRTLSDGIWPQVLSCEGPQDHRGHSPCPERREQGGARQQPPGRSRGWLPAWPRAARTRPHQSPTAALQETQAPCLRIRRPRHAEVTQWTLACGDSGIEWRSLGPPNPSPCMCTDSPDSLQSPP